MAMRDAYFNHLFTDEERLDCFKLTSPDWPETVWGYVPADSVTGKLLSSIVSSRAQRVTLALRSERESHAHAQFVIDRVVINGWVRTPVDPEDAMRSRERRAESGGFDPR